MQQGQGPDRQASGQGDAFERLISIVHALALILTPFSRRDFGSRSFRSAGLAVLYVIGFASVSASSPVFSFLWLWLLAVATQRLRTSQHARKGIVVHSGYDGFPWFGWKLCRGRSEESAYKAEAGFWLLASILALLIDPPFGLFLLIAAVGLLAFESYKRELDKKMLADMRDARIEQNHRAAQFRDAGPF
ncbi:hypothetical protein [Fimbriiglobus ruber]|uniref:Uncharacterized protein n=1 Tax=Fimbriiglobus ruber TaxID=1908690 RepID=A0A225D8R1_9BACT|nr:hypothetical protein [Fimbriiglobus ruber]OWK34928.1 hypothetical protein FRUB_09770 [Fimbriiglobus ruber]